jgi:hypothetical protein
VLKALEEEWDFKYFYYYGTVRVKLSNLIKNTMDNDLIYSVRNQDVA